MTLPFRRPQSTVARLELVEPTVRRIDPAEVAAALGGEPTGDRIPPAGPVARYAMRAELYRRHKAADQGVKVPLSGADRTRLQQLAASLNGDGPAPAPELVANAILSMALDAGIDRAALAARLAAAKSDPPAV